ncbi:hypothetical protein V1511DRAFT_504118 [Dipodascopsis uninucleata]
MALVYVKMLMAFTGIVGLGVSLYNTTVPTEAEILTRLPSESRRRYLEDQKYKGRESLNDEHNALQHLVMSNAESSRPAWMLTDSVEPACIIRERDRQSWSAQAIGKAQAAAQAKMEAEAKRLQVLEQSGQKKSWW